MSQNQAAASEARAEENDVSDDPSLHDPNCTYFLYAQVHSKGLRTAEQVKQRLTENLNRSGRKRKAAVTKNQLTEAMSENGVVTQYLKSKREMYASYKPLLKSFCRCKAAKIRNRMQHQHQGQESKKGQDQSKEQVAERRQVKKSGHQEKVVKPHDRPATTGIGASGKHKLTQHQIRSLKEIDLYLTEDEVDEEME